MRLADTNLQIEEAATTDEIEEKEWSRVAAGRSIYASQAWYRAMELHEFSSPSYLVARRTNDQVVGVLPSYLTGFEGNSRYDPSQLFGDLFIGDLTLAETWFPGMVGGARAGNLNELLVDRAVLPHVRRRTLQTLFNRFWEVAEDQTRAAWLMYLSSEDTSALEGILPHGALILLTDADTCLDVQWDSFDDYLKDLSSQRRYAVKREIKYFRNSGAKTSAHRFTPEICSTLAPLLANVQAKHSKPRSVEWLTRYLEQQAQFLEQDSIVFLCRRDARVVGFSLFFRFQRKLYGRVVGLNYSSATHSEYFNLLFYEPIRLAIEEGFRTIHLGIDAYEAKLARGATLRPLWSILYRGDNRLADSRLRSEKWNAKKAEFFLERYGKLLRHPIRRQDWRLP